MKYTPINDHSSLPWFVDENLRKLKFGDEVKEYYIAKDFTYGRFFIARMERENMRAQKRKANAEFIIRACNEYYPNKEEIERLKRSVEELTRKEKENG